MIHSRPSAALATALCTLALLTAGCAGRTLEDLPEQPADPLPPSGDTPGAVTNQEQPPGGHRESADLEPAPATDLPASTREPLPVLTLTAEEACRRQPQGTRATPTEPEFRQQLVGSWLLCDETSVFGTTDEVGIIIHADLTWQKLLRDEDGKLSAASAWGQAGNWESIDTSLMNGPGVFQLNIEIDGSGTVITHPIFAAEPDLMRLNNNGVFVANYAKL